MFTILVSSSCFDDMEIGVWLFKATPPTFPYFSTQDGTVPTGPEGVISVAVSEKV